MTAKEKENFKRLIRRKMGKAIGDYSLIEPGEIVTVGLSGGKDSLALVDLLATRAKFSKAKFRIAAVHVSAKEISYQVDLQYLSDFCSQRNVVFIHREIELGGECFEGQKPVCFYCSRNRRKALFEISKEIGSRTLALGHHLDDAIETLLMNMVFQGSVSSIPAKLSMFKATFKLIRPLILLTSCDLKIYAEISGFRELVKNCPFERKTQRDEMRKIIDQLEQIFPNTRKNIFESTRNIIQEYLPEGNSNS